MKTFIDKKYIYDLINNSIKPTKKEIENILNKAKTLKGLSHSDVAKLILAPNSLNEQILKIAGEIKDEIYKNRVVLFAPLYISNFCQNECLYCGYKHSNKINRKKLNKEDLIKEVKILESLGHKRIALEVGEDHNETSIDYILDAIDTIYEAGSIRRINVNIAATTVENFKRLKAKDIGTYILFQETYERDNYKHYHKGLKGDYERQLYAHHRAMEAGIDDVGAGVLFGLSDWRFDVIALIIHNQELENEYGVGFHTVSVPRLKNAIGVDSSEYEHLIDDTIFEKIVAILRMAMPYVGMILSTRETKEVREKLIKSGISQISAGSKTGVGGYNDSVDEEDKMDDQFELSDERSPMEVIKWLLKSDYIPSYCTACYRTGRTGRDFMDIVKAGDIGDICLPNALMTLAEYIVDYGDKELKDIGFKFIEKESGNLKPELKELIAKNIELIKSGKKDLFI